MTETSNWRENYPMKDMVDRFLGLAPEWFLYLRRDLRFPDPTVNAAYGDNGFNNIEAPYWGTGYKTDLVKIPGRLGTVMARFEGVKGSTAGLVHEMIDTLYTPRDVFPALQDWVIQVEWNKKTIDAYKSTAKPVRVINLWQVAEVVKAHQTQTAYFAVRLQGRQEDLEKVPKGSWWPFSYKSD